MRVTSDLRYAFRSLARNLGFTLAVVFSLALGIGGNAAIFSVVNGLLWHPAGMEDLEQLVAPRVSYKKLNLDKIGMSATDFADIRNSKQTFSQAAMLDLEGMNYTGAASPERLQAAFVTSEWFQVFKCEPILGRGFHPEEDQPGANHVVVLSYNTWKRLFGGERSILGRAIELNRSAYRVVGVMPSDFRWPTDAALWIPIGLAPRDYGPNNRFNENYFAVARLAPGVSYGRAASVIGGLSQRVLEQVPFARGSQWRMVLEPLTEYTAGDLKKPMFILLGAVAFVLLIACSNIAGLLLVRGTARGRELAIRTALGAGRRDLMIQALVETFWLGLFGTVLGFGLAAGILRVLLGVAKTQLATELSVRIDGTVLAFTTLAGLLSAAVFGLVPALHISQLGQQYERLKEGGRSETGGPHRERARSILVTAQIALAMVLLIGSGLLLKTLANLRNVNTGFDAHQVMTASVALPASQYRDADKQAAFFQSAIDRLSDTPGMKRAAAVSTVPFAGGWGDPTGSFNIEGRLVPQGDPGFHGSARYATPGYFEAMRIPLLAGRYFDPGDRKNAQPVAIIDLNLAKRYWPNQNSLGQRLRRNSRDPWATIVGIVGHVKQTSLAADPGRGTYYFSLYQQPGTEAFLVAKGELAPAGLAQAIRSAVHTTDPSQAVFDVKSMQERIGLALGPQQFALGILMVFAMTAVTLAVTGLYGVISQSVTRRNREIGIRTAVGAERRDIMTLIIAQAMRLVLVGLAIGVAAGALLARLVANQLFAVSPVDPTTFVMTGLLLTAAALLASFVPAWRAARLDPTVALRND
jgi:predicted permease